MPITLVHSGLVTLFQQKKESVDIGLNGRRPGQGLQEKFVFYTELEALSCSPILTPISSFWPKGLHLVDVSLLTVTFLLLISDRINLAEKK